MPITVTCDKCGATYAVPDARAGKTGYCKCGSKIQVPDPAARAASRRVSTQRAAAALPAGNELECRHCGMQTPVGKACQWCGEPLAAPKVAEEHGVLLGASRPQHHPGHAGILHRQEASGRGPEAPMPSTVRSIRALMMFWILLLCGSVLTGLVGMGSAQDEEAVVALVLMLFGGGLLAIYIWLWVALGRASRTGWWVFLVLMGLDLVLAPLNLLASIGLAATASGDEAAMASGTLVGTGLGLLLAVAIVYYWLQPDVKEWYGV